MEKIKWMYFPADSKITNKLMETVGVFENNYELISSSKYNYESNKVLNIVSNDLKKIGYEVEIDKKHKIKIPVLYGENGITVKSFDLDAYENEQKIILEIEAGRAVCNNQVIKDFFEACMIKESEYLVIAVRTNYRGSDDFTTIKRWFETFYANSKMIIPFKGLLIIGY